MRGQQFGPQFSAGIIRNQILAQFDQHMRQAIPGAMLEHAIANQFTGIRKIITDAQAAVRLQGRK